MPFPNIPKYVRIAIVPNIGIFDVNTSSNGEVAVTGGQESGLLTFLAQGLGFRPTIVVPEDKEWGVKQDNGSWTGLIGLLQRDEADIGIGIIKVSAERATVVDFSYPYDIDDLIFATKTPGFVSKTSAIFKPFGGDVWACLLTSMIVIVLLLWMLTIDRQGLLHIIFYVFGVVVQQSRKFKLPSPLRAVVGSWILGGTLLSISYTARLLSFLTVPLKDGTINNRYELSSVLDGGNYACFGLVGASDIKVLQDSTYESDRNIAKYLTVNKWFIEPDQHVIRQYLSRKNYAVVASKNVFQLMSNQHVFLPKEGLASLFVSVAVNRKFCCKDALDSTIHRISAAGLYEKTKKDYFFKTQLKYRKNLLEDVDDHNDLRLDDIVGSFSILFFGYIISGLVLFLEIIVFNIKR